ncbi:hypothetical protein [Halobiforma nitratireducens]|uniref:hypothetical protein n=1 Tax=Halobiforma nitratireducens TaxID=130048 RepID=UPI0009FBCD97|nr:hypothetical protein [Halobiforma nitratireducens]
MNRRTLLALASASAVVGLSGCTGGDDEETNTDDEETDTEEEGESEDMSGGYDFSSCDYELNDEKINAPLDESQYNDPSGDSTTRPEYDGINVEIGYQEDIEDDELKELESIFGHDATHSEDSRGYSTPRDTPIDKCDVAKLSNRDYIEYIVPIPIDEP